MASIFTHAAGKVSRVSTGRPAVPFRVDFGGGKNRAFIVTQAAISMQGNYQFLHTLNDMIYVYVFGDRISELQISGLAFAETCWGRGVSGMEEVLDFYRDNRIAERETPCKIRFGAGAGPDRAMWGLLTGAQVEVSRPEITLGQWFLRFHVLPK